MEILVTRAKAFLKGGLMLNVYPDGHPCTVPGWVRDTATFKAGVGDGSVRELVAVPAEPPAAAESDTKKTGKR